MLGVAAAVRGAAVCRADPAAAVVGDVRVEAVLPTVVRLEVRGPHGFEDRPTLRVLDRGPAGPALPVTADGGRAAIHGPTFTVRLPHDATSLAGAEVDGPDGHPVWTYAGPVSQNAWLPAPGDHPAAWAFGDTPRLARTADPAAPHTGTVGWDAGNDAEDVYVFLPPGGDYRALRADLLRLTGPTEMPPLWALGAWDSRWYEYTAQTAVQQVDEYRRRGIPLDGLVVDTDWRNGGSHGYDVNTRDFPDLAAFFRAAHDRHVHVMFNDHPEPQAAALDPVELRYRQANVDRLLDAGLDVWWYDRNWRTHLKPPLPGLRPEVWGMELYHDLTAADRPGRRPMIMANVDGTDNGRRTRAPDVTAHRFPIQWTGDIRPSFATLRQSIANAVHAGVAAAFPYQSDDLGGHVADPTPEGYVRWIEYGALSPVYRPHCTRNLQRMPWAFGPEAERITRDYVRMRYRLLPTLYAAAHENYLTGEPVLRRLDLDFPGEAAAAREDQYLLGHDLLVAPIARSTAAAGPVPDALFHTADGTPGIAADYFANDHLTGPPAVSRTDANVDFDWGRGSPDPAVPVDHFSARWAGRLGPVPADGGGRVLSATADDGVRVWLDGKPVIDRWLPQAGVTTDAPAPLVAGHTYDLRVEYNELTNDALCRLSWRPAVAEAKTSRDAWVPPGSWVDAWTGEVVTGPRAVTASAALDRTPMWVRAGSVVLLGPDVQYTGEKPWDPITVDLYPDAARAASATLYEDDGDSTAYRAGAGRTTAVTATPADGGREIGVDISPARGTFEHALDRRGWTLRLHPFAGGTFDRATVDGVAAAVRTIGRQADAMPLAATGGSPDGDVVEVAVPPQPVAAARRVMVNFKR